jgi:methylated-DNA-[protein]-cysteine S-methyltransferase
MMSETRYHLFDTRIGICGIAWGEDGLQRVQLPEADAHATERRVSRQGALHREQRPPEEIAACIDGLRRYFGGEPVDFGDFLLDFSLIRPFDARILRLLREVGFGRIVTYGGLAERAGHPGAAQAVGAAMARNPWPIVVPCYRVVAASGKLGGFSAFGGARVKRMLLGMEGAVPEEEATGMLPGLFA